jgi:menaquinone-dependent protoporphyrinogen oxidase
MSEKMLVTYASRYGSTQEVAATMVATLRDRGHRVDFMHMPRVRTLEGYHAIVLGAPIYIGRWHQDAREFLERHRDGLRRRPVAVFALGPIHNDEQEVKTSRTQLDTELAQFPWFKPVAVAMFVGRYEPARLRFRHRMLAALPASPLHGVPATDLRDWDAIRDWALNLTEQLAV